MHVITFFQRARAQRYGLRVVKFYSHADPRIKPDKYEPNKFCHYADCGVRSRGVRASFSDTLTIDNPHAVDWLRVTVPATQSIHILTKARPFPLEADTSDIDVYVMTVPNAGIGTTLTLVGADTAAGSAASVTVTAPARPTHTSYYTALLAFARRPPPHSPCYTQA